MGYRWNWWMIRPSESSTSSYIRSTQSKEGRTLSVYMLEPKAVGDLDDPEVKLKRDVAVKWCGLATKYAAGTGGKPWKYALIPHDVITDNMTVRGLAERFGYISPVSVMLR
jgi:hypothetical protein